VEGERVSLDDDLSELTTWIHGTRPLVDVLDRVATIGLGAIDGSDEVSVVLVATPHEGTIGATSDVGHRLDERQRELGRGPCLDAAYGGSVVLVDDLAIDERWPRYGPSAVDLGIHSSISAPLPVQEHVVGAVDWYSHEPSTFAERHFQPALDFAARVAVVVTNAHLFGSMKDMADHMQMAMQSRAVIEQAKGVIMATSRCEPDAAFQSLVEQSQFENRKLRDVAEEIVSRQSR
jgi:GAF domain-containing protein